MKINLQTLSRDFFNSEKSGGFILIIITVLSIVLTNSSFGQTYMRFWNLQIHDHSIVHWVNDGLMSIFFLLIGLELEREILMGELSGFKKAALPIFGAIGGMVVPAVIFLLFNYGTPTQAGSGIPMATDIAFAIGILSLLGNKVPLSLKVFLTALAVIDDLGAILVIAIFYTVSLNWMNLLLALAIYLLLFGIRRMKVDNLFPYLIVGTVMWYFMLNSGVHPTITGVLLAFAIPEAPSLRLQHYLHKPVAFFVLPIFAAANTVILFGDGFLNSFSSDESYGILAGLILGKPIGIALFAFLGVAMGWAVLPKQLNWKHIISVGFLGGIGFTMSIFITLLAFEDETFILHSKIAILTASCIAGILGFVLLNNTLKKNGTVEVQV